MIAPHYTTGYSPFYLQYGRHPRTPEMARLDSSGPSITEESWAKRLERDLRKAHDQVVVREEDKKKKRVERSRQRDDKRQYQEGDRVFMKVPKKPGMSGKIQTTGEGPFIVIGCMQGNTYRIKKADNFRQRYIRHFDQLKLVEQRDGRLQDQTKEEEKQTEHRPAAQRHKVWKKEDSGKKMGPNDVERCRDSEDLEGDGHEEDEEQEQDENNQQEVTQRTETQAEPRRSGRERRPPDRYGDWTV